MSTIVTNYKTDDIVSGNYSSGVRNPYLTYSQWGRALDLEGFRYYLESMYDRSHEPLFVIENGLGVVDHVKEDGKIHDVYCIDLISSNTGEMSKRYGFIYLDRDNQENIDQSISTPDFVSRLIYSLPFLSMLLTTSYFR